MLARGSGNGATRWPRSAAGVAQGIGRRRGEMSGGAEENRNGCGGEESQQTHTAGDDMVKSVLGHTHGGRRRREAARRRANGRREGAESGHEVGHGCGRRFRGRRQTMGCRRGRRGAPCACDPVVRQAQQQRALQPASAAAPRQARRAGAAVGQAAATCPLIPGWLQRSWRCTHARWPRPAGWPLQGRHRGKGRSRTISRG